MRPHRICVAGSINVDLVAYLDASSDASRYAEGKSFGMSAGGKSLNTALTIAVLDDVHLVGRIGRDSFGAFIAETLVSAGMATDGLVMDEAANTGVGHVRVSAAGEYDTVVIPGANGKFSPDDIDSVLERHGSPGYAVLNLEVPLETCRHAAVNFRSAGSTVVINVSPVLAGAETLLPLADIVVLNREEAQIVLGRPEEYDPGALLRGLRDAGANAVVLTMGAEGVAYIDTDGLPGALEGTPVPVTNSIGAGDTFLGAFVAGLAQGLPFDAALAAGDVAGRIVCQKSVSYLEATDRLQLEPYLTAPDLQDNPSIVKASGHTHG